MKVVVILSFILLSCKYVSSPYTVEVPKLLQNNSALVRIAREEPSVPADFKIALISDTHNYYDELNDLVQKINERGPYSFVIIAGDITNDGLREEYLETRRILNKLNWPYLVVLGNHDCLANGVKIYKRLFGDIDFTLNYRDISFVLLNTNNWETSGAVPDYQFLESSLSSATGAFKVVVTHVPMNDEDRFTSDEIRRFEEIVQNNNVDYVIWGHNHNPGEATFAGADQITIGAPSKGSYYELIRSGGGLSHQKVDF